MSVSELILEVTRNCNMECAHCLRGKSENLKMTKEIVDRVFEEISEIGVLVFTGGDPSLAEDVIEEVVEKIKESNVTIDSFWLATNAKKYSTRMVNALIELYVLCCYKDGCGLAISRDQFHERVDERNIERYRALSFFREKDKNGHLKDDRILNEGLAYENGIGQKNLKVDSHLSINDDDNNNIELLYVNAKGDLLSCCDLSFENQEEYKLGNIKKDKIENLMMVVV